MRESFDDVLETQEKEQAALNKASRAQLIRQTATGFSLDLGGYITQQMQAMGDTHPDAASRAQSIRAYVNREYGDVLVPLRSAPFVLASHAPGVTILLQDSHALLAAMATASHDPRRAIALSCPVD